MRKLPPVVRSRGRSHMGEWCNVAFVKGTVREIAAALGTVLGEEGRAVVAAPPPRARPRSDAMQYGDGESAPVWGVALAPGADGWVVVRTAPGELLCERASDELGETRLAKLARALGSGAEAFQLNLYDGVAMVLLEANAKARTRACGYTLDEPTRWQSFELTEHETSFGLLAGVPPDARERIRDASSVDAAEGVCTIMGGDNVAFTLNGAVLDALICHRPVSGDGVQLMYFARAAPAAEARPPLAIEVRESVFSPETGPRDALTPAPWGGWPPQRRLHLLCGGGEAWITGSWISAPDARRGGALLDALARWLGVDAEAARGGASLLEPLFCTLEAERDAIMLHLGERERVTLRVRFERRARPARAAVDETDPALRERVVRLLGPALRDGVRARSRSRARWRKLAGASAPLVERWSRFTDEPVRVAYGAGFVGEKLVAGAWRGDRGVCLVADTPGEAAHDVVTFEGLVSALAPAPVGGIVAACVTRSTRLLPSPGIGSDDEAAIVLVDLAKRTTKTLVAKGVDPFTAIVWAPEGDALAVRLAREGASLTAVFELGREGAKPRFESLPGVEPVAWDARGLLLVARDYHTFGPPAYGRWSAGREAEPCEAEHTSPDGALRVALREDALVVRDASGAERSWRLGSKDGSLVGFHTGPIWPTARSIVVAADDPCLIDLDSGAIRLLAPAARAFAPCAASASGLRFAAFHREGNLVWGTKSD
jgi:hypothetical protein